MIANLMPNLSAEDAARFYDSGKLKEEFGKIYVSLNHGIFLCHNCARLHQINYGVEVSFVKSIVDYMTVNERSTAGQTQSGAPRKRKLKYQRWTYTQLRVLIISGGNRAFREYME